MALDIGIMLIGLVFLGFFAGLPDTPTLPILGALALVGIGLYAFYRDSQQP